MSENATDAVRQARTVLQTNYDVAVLRGYLSDANDLWQTIATFDRLGEALHAIEKADSAELAAAIARKALGGVLVAGSDPPKKPPIGIGIRGVNVVCEKPVGGVPSPGGLPPPLPEAALAACRDALTTTTRERDEARQEAERIQREFGEKWIDAERRASEYRESVPTKLELREVIAEHVRRAEPFATTDGVAGAVHAYLADRFGVETKEDSDG